jgi:hypothetical protein
MSELELVGIRAATVLGFALTGGVVPAAAGTYRFTTADTFPALLV